MREKESVESAYFLSKVEETFDGIGCPICRLMGTAMESYMDNLLYERINDPLERKKFTEGHGYCRKHFRKMEDYVKNHPELGILGLSIQYHSLKFLFEEVREEFDDLGIGKGCFMCEMESDNEKRYLATFEEYVKKAERLVKYETSPSMVCLKHTKMLLKRNEISSGFAGIQREKLKRVFGNMEEFIRKSDYRYSKEEVTQEEGQAWKNLSRFLS